MGYTHYWYAHPEMDIEAYGKALKNIRLLIEHAPEGLLAGGDGTGAPEYQGRIFINGRGDEAHETLFLPFHPQDWKRASFPQYDEGGRLFQFCKTAMKDYDPVVTGSLLILRHFLPEEAIKISSDGAIPEDWEEGKEWAEAATGLDLTEALQQLSGEGEEEE